MKLDKKSMLELSEMIAEAVVNVLEKRGLTTGKDSGKPDKSAYQKTESLLYNYVGFKRIVADKQLEIEQIKKYGVPQRSGSIVGYSPRGGTVRGTVLPEESVEQAVQRITESVQDTVDAIALVDNCMAALKDDPYYEILEMRYFEGRTQEDIALKFGVSQVTISNNKSRLVRELSMRIFPNQTVNEMLK